MNAWNEPQAKAQGGHTLSKLKLRCDDLFKINLAHSTHIMENQCQIKQLKNERDGLRRDLFDKIDTIAKSRQFDAQSERLTASLNEAEFTFHDELKRRKLAEFQLEKVNIQLDKCRQDYKAIQTDHIEKTRLCQTQGKLVTEQNTRIKANDRIAEEHLFTIDESKVIMIKLTRKNEVLEKEIAVLSERNEYLTRMEISFQQETLLLQNKLQELFNENTVVTTNYQAVKKNRELKLTEFEDLNAELNEAKAACQLAMRQRRLLQADFAACEKDRGELADKNKTFESILQRKEKDIFELLAKVNDTIGEYEMKLEKKEEQMWAITAQTSVKTIKSGPLNIIEPDFVSDVEKRWQAKEFFMQAEIDRLIASEKETEDASKSIKLI